MFMSSTKFKNATNENNMARTKAKSLSDLMKIIFSERRVPNPTNHVES